MPQLPKQHPQSNQEREAELRKVFDRYYRPLVLFALEYVHDIEQSKDIVQEFFLSLWKNGYLSGVESGKLSSYLYTSVRNSCYSYISKKDILRDSSAIREPDIPIDWVSTIDDELMQKAHIVLASLPPRTRQAVEYVIMQDHSYKEAAAKMGISVNTVKYLLKDGLKKAREICPAIAFLLYTMLSR